MNIRRLFTDFFKSKDHTHLPSSPLIPEDSTLMFANSGMVQFKKFFLGHVQPSHKNVVTVQKCLRAGGKHNDFEAVGTSPRHHTFFEMLGNFSFGNYFKEEAICYAWEFITQTLSLDKNKLYITVYHNDNFSFELWKKLTGFTDSRIFRISTDDNFWSMGDIGPCGPCSEIYYDHGEHVSGYIDHDKSFIGDRFVEIWNLVFMEFNRNESGQLLELPKKCIDTGMGLERIDAVLSKTYDNYQSSHFSALIKNICSLLNSYEIGSKHRVIADHIRAAAFLIADGLTPGNDGRSYILRKIIRRASVFANKAGASSPMLHKAFLPLISENSGACISEFYPELLRAKKTIESILLQEEENFSATLKNGRFFLENALQNVKSGEIFPGEIAFKLYDTYGLPLEVTKDFLKERNAELDIHGFNKSMEHQKEIARKSWIGSGDVLDENIWNEILANNGGTEFFGYNLNEERTLKILHILRIDDKKAYLILNATPFYAESGGQKSDTGQMQIFGNDNNITPGLVNVINVKKRAESLYVHECEIINPNNLSVGNSVKPILNIQKRKSLSINHTATHILHYALRTILGEHVTQKGSMVSDDMFRFDFNHGKSLSGDEISNIEDMVNSIIESNFLVETNITDINGALNSGAIGLFGEKYGESVRVVKIGPSSELCGGTHASRTSEIMFFKILSESAIAFGIRRIEAIAGPSAIKYAKEKLNLLTSISKDLKCSDTDISNVILGLKTEIKKLESLNSSLYTRIMNDALTHDKPIISTTFNDIPFEYVRNFTCTQSKKYSKICVIGSSTGAITNFCIVVPAGSNFSALEIATNVKDEFPTAKGGGNKLMAQITCSRESAKSVLEFILNAANNR